MLRLQRPYSARERSRASCVFVGSLLGSPRDSGHFGLELLPDWATSGAVDWLLRVALLNFIGLLFLLICPIMRLFSRTAQSQRRIDWFNLLFRLLY
jgi:hypothetical protein